MAKLNFHIIGLVSGMVLVAIGALMILPSVIDLKDHDADVQTFILSGVSCIFVGGVLYLANKDSNHQITRRETFFLTTFVWLMLSFFAALPYYMSSDIDLSFTDAFFEAVSGITTTGATVLTDLDHVSRGILFWRALTQWIGGIGIIALAFVFLPILKIGGMQLFQTESSERSDKIAPRTYNVVFMIVSAYAIITFLCGMTYLALGMDYFDALCHALTTVSTGGFSTHDASFGFFTRPALQWAATFFMFAGGLPFVLLAQAVFKGRPKELIRSTQVRTYALLCVAFIAVMSLWLMRNDLYGFTDAVRMAAFNIVSIMTTTGYATTDYLLWGSFPVAFFFFLTYMGGCTGSTAGGMKIMRMEIVFRTVNLSIKRLIYPHGIFSTRYACKTLHDDVARSIMTFLLVFVISNIVLVLGLSFYGLDIQTAISAAATMTANVGPGIGDIIGPSGNFASLPDGAKWLLDMGMILGRLEFLTVLVLFSSSFWRS